MAKEDLNPNEVEGIAEGQAFRERQDQSGQNYQSGQSLAVDRGRTAQTIVFDVGKWKHRVNVVDFSGYDVRRKNMPEKKRNSVEELIDNPEEADRLNDYLTGKKGSGKQYKISNFDDFKKAFREEFTREGYAGTRLWEVIGDQEDLMLKLYATTTIQNKVTTDSKEGRVNQLMTQYHVSKSTANNMYEQIRKNETQLVQKGMLPIIQRTTYLTPEVSLGAAPRRVTISQRSKEGGVTYQRAKPQKFNAPQERFLRQNKDMPMKELTATYQTIWKDENRTPSSLYYKRYRLLKTG